MATWKDWLLLAIAILVGGWLLFDGLRAFVVGDYVTPSSGDFAGKLGPWAGLLERIGIAPRSNLAKGLHVLAGATWLISLVGMLSGAAWSRNGLVVAAVLSLWYLPFGTLAGLIALALLFFLG